MVSESRLKANKKYDENNTRQFKFKLNNKTDADIIALLDSLENKQGYFKSLIRYAIELDLRTVNAVNKASNRDTLQE